MDKVKNQMNENNSFPFKEQGLSSGPIGVFDSGYGGLTILENIQKALPDNDFIYLGDNARTPYGTRSFDVVYKYTLECVNYLFEMGCPLVILACNTASAKALRSIQQIDLPRIDASRRVLGVIRPTVESLCAITKNGHIGLLATSGTVQSDSYPLEIQKLYSTFQVSSEACPMWVPLIENNEHNSAGADYFVRKNIEQLLAKDPYIDTIILGCTHYPLLENKIRQYLSPQIALLTQGELVAKSLLNYLAVHSDMCERCSTHGSVQYLTTESVDKFTASASIFLNQKINPIHIELD